MSLVVGAFAVGLYWNNRPGAAPFSLPRPGAPAQRQQSCGDDCEQNAAVNHWPEVDMRACKARCGEGQPPARPNEIPRSITVAPADHRGGLVPPPDRRIQRTH